MSHTPHELAEEFPGKADTIHRLKASNDHFVRLADEYHEVNRRIHTAETNVEPMDGTAEETLRKQRARLKDQIASILANA